MTDEDLDENFLIPLGKSKVEVEGICHFSYPIE